MKNLFILTIFFTFLTAISCGKKESSKEENKTAKPKIDIFSAVFMNNVEVVKQHIEAGSDLNASEPTNKSTPLITAAAFGKYEVAELLINAGADLNYKNNDGSTALHTAAFFGHENMVKLLLKNNADITIKNNVGKTAYELVSMPFEDLKSIYDTLEKVFESFGVKLDFEYIKTNSPKIAKLLEDNC